MRMNYYYYCCYYCLLCSLRSLSVLSLQEGYYHLRSLLYKLQGDLIHLLKIMVMSFAFILIPFSASIIGISVNLGQLLFATASILLVVIKITTIHYFNCCSVEVMESAKSLYLEVDYLALTSFRVIRRLLLYLMMLLLFLLNVMTVSMIAFDGTCRHLNTGSLA